MDLPFRNETNNIDQMIKNDKHGYMVVNLEDESTTLLQIMDDIETKEDRDDNSTIGKQPNNSTEPE